MAIEAPPGSTGSGPQIEIGSDIHAEPEAIASLAELLGGAQTPQSGGAGAQLAMADAGAYDGHVALVLDDDLPTDFGSTLDLLTHAHDLFDVPAMNFADAHDDGVPT